jgi:hypothetical protein
MWYRTREHDSKLSKKEYESLKILQQKAISGIHKGDKALAELDALLGELHEQRIVYVSGHEKDMKTFTELSTSLGFDSEGDPTINTEFVDVPGWEFYYVLTTVTPQGTSTQRVYVGEEKGINSSWSYGTDQAVGWVRSWKRLHYDNSAILSGRKERLNPVLAEQKGCRL